MSFSSRFLGSNKVTLDDIDASRRFTDLAENKEAMKVKLAELATQIAEFQNILFAQKKHRVLIILQGMDTSGKDGTVKSVFAATNPAGIRSVSFKAPTSEELAHDFLWRVHQKIPASGELVIFNRSHYEDVLITKVHARIDAKELERRYAHIRAFEQMLVETGTTLLKLFLHISKDAQKTRLEERIIDPNKHWKFSPQDLIERASWPAYQEAYQAAINATHTESTPWHIIPADSKSQRNLIVASIVAEKLASLGLAYPPPNPSYFQLKVE